MEKSLEIIQKLIDERKINGEEAIILIQAVSKSTTYTGSPIHIEPIPLAPINSKPEIIYATDATDDVVPVAELNDLVKNGSTTTTMIYG